MQLFAADPAFQIERVAMHRVEAMRAELVSQGALNVDHQSAAAPNVAHYAIRYESRLLALLGVRAVVPALGWQAASSSEEFGVLQSVAESALVVHEWLSFASDRRLRLLLRLEALRPLIANVRRLGLSWIYWGADDAEMGVLQRMFGFRVVASAMDTAGFRRYLLRLDYARSLKGLVDSAGWLAVDEAQAAAWAIELPRGSALDAP